MSALFCAVPTRIILLSFSVCSLTLFALFAMRRKIDLFANLSVYKRYGFLVVFVIAVHDNPFFHSFLPIATILFYDTSIISKETNVNILSLCKICYFFGFCLALVGFFVFSLENT